MMWRLRNGLSAVCLLWMLAPRAHAAEWQYAFSPDHRMHVAFGPASTGTQGVTEIVNHSCHEKLGKCGWSISVAIPCKFGDTALGVVLLPKPLVRGSKEEAASYLKCGGPNSGLPGTFVYQIENDRLVGEMVKFNGPVLMRVGSEKGAVMDVTMDFLGAGPQVSRADAGIRAR